MSVIPDLIDKQDNFEIVRDQIASILALETTSQQALAVTAGKDPALWKFRVFLERSNPWESFRNADEPGGDDSPIINISYDNSSFNKAASNVVERQESESIYNIDCYAYAPSANVVAGGHTPGDKAAALVLHRVIRLVRNILMAGLNTYLQLRGTVWIRWPQNINVFQPQIDGRTVEQVIAARIAFQVNFSELSPQVDGENIELLYIDVKRTLDGQIIAEADYEYPLP